MCKDSKALTEAKDQKRGEEAVLEAERGHGNTAEGGNKIKEDGVNKCFQKISAYASPHVMSQPK